MAISLKAVKAVAFGLGGLLIVGNILVVYALVSDNDDTPVSTIEETQAVPEAPVAGNALELTPAPTGIGFDPITLPVSAGSEVVGTSVSDNRLVVHVKVQTAVGPRDELIVIDLTNGEVLGELRLDVQ